MLIKQMAQMPTSKIVLWCYLIWYLSTVFRYFDPAPTIWFNALGISLIVGIALSLSVNRSIEQAMHTLSVDRWQSFRLFFMPFAVSSFSALIKGQGFILIFPPSIAEVMIQLGLCAGFVCTVRLARWRRLSGEA